MVGVTLFVFAPPSPNPLPEGEGDKTNRIPDKFSFALRRKFSGMTGVLFVFLYADELLAFLVEGPTGSRVLPLCGSPEMTEFFRHDDVLKAIRRD